MSKDLDIPEKEIILYGRKLAEDFLIYGMPSKEKRRTFLKVEKVERELKSRPGQKRVRRTISHADIEKLRKGGKLTKAEKKSLPSIRQKTIYNFAMVGPRGEVGFGASAYRRSTPGR